MGCRTARGIVEDAPPERDAPARGDAAARAALTRDDELAIDAVIVTRFFRPSGGQARWIDPRPLGDVRDSVADARIDPDDAWADALRAATGHPRVCVYDADADEACAGREGGVLRFSHPYAAGDGARTFVRWWPARRAGAEGPLPARGQPTFEMVFTMARAGGGGWRIVSQRAITP
ncbi:hypothetical protein [Gemmatirosa kalamazoonensis]|uniref:hypothetical protein n=1 Tax=Gemmatirosa kalamazoonensis TaxID=861299 RepID=UPI00046CD9C4|nr:hypothetical protein [Gemmatirosa kalamazoonensis]